MHIGFSRRGSQTLSWIGLTACLLASPRTVPAADPFAEYVRSTEPRTPEDERRGFKLPPGFEAQLVAAEPEIGKPMNLAFDERGRLWITESQEYPFPAATNGPARDKIRILSEFSETGRAQKITTFAEGLNIPIGLLPYKSGVIAFSIPNIYFLQDTDGDGRADKKELILGPFGFDRDTHGLTSSFRRGYDGWIYADHGYNNETTLTAKDGSHIKMQSGNTYRFRPDGSRVEQNTWGQVNPFGLMFDQYGDLWSADCHSSPIYQLLRGAYYPSFGKPDDGLGFAPNICSHQHGSTAIGGIVYYAAEHFPSDFWGNAFIGNVMTCRINRDSFIFHGSTRIAKEQPDFLVADDPWFRPVDLQLGPDGALYVADFYNRIIGHYEVPLTHPGRDRERGRIWRIVYKGADGRPLQPFDLAQKSVDELIEGLKDSNLTARMLAMNYLSDYSGVTGVETLQKTIDELPGTFQKIHAMWTLFRAGKIEEKTLVLSSKQPDALIRLHVEKIFAEIGDLTPTYRAVALNALRDEDPFVQRAAAEVIGRDHWAGGLRELLALRQSAPSNDVQLLHTVRMAMRNKLATEVGVYVKQLERTNFFNQFDMVPQMNLDEAGLRSIADVAVGVPSAPAASFLLRNIRSISESADTVSRYLRHAARYLPESDLGLMATVAREQFRDKLDLQATVFKSVQEGMAARGTALNDSLRDWGAELASRLLLASSAVTNDSRSLPVQDPAQSSKRLQTVAELAGALKLAELESPLARLLRQPEIAVEARGAMAQALRRLRPDNIPGRTETVPAATLALLNATTPLIGDATVPTALREKATGVLVDTEPGVARTALTEVFQALPQRLQNKVAQGLAANSAGAELLLDWITQGKAPATILQDRKMNDAIVAANAENRQRIAQLTKGLTPTDGKIAKLIDDWRAAYSITTSRGTPAEGTVVFAKNCAVCHQLGGVGGLIGPQLDGIGARGLERLCEDILDPNRSVDQAFRNTLITRTDGDVVSGLFRREEGELVILAESTGKEISIPKAKIAIRKQSETSLMPENFGEILSAEDFNRLLTYLLSIRVQGQ